MITFKPLYELMKKENISWYRLQRWGMDATSIYRIKRGENITLNTLNKLCFILGVTPSEIIDYTPDEYLEL